MFHTHDEQQNGDKSLTFSPGDLRVAMTVFPFPPLFTKKNLPQKNIQTDASPQFTKNMSSAAAILMVQKSGETHQLRLVDSLSHLVVEIPLFTTGFSINPRWKTLAGVLNHQQHWSFCRYPLFNGIKYTSRSNESIERRRWCDVMRGQLLRHAVNTKPNPRGSEVGLRRVSFFFGFVFSYRRNVP